MGLHCGMHSKWPPSAMLGPSMGHLACCGDGLHHAVRATLSCQATLHVMGYCVSHTAHVVGCVWGCMGNNVCGNGISS